MTGILHAQERARQGVVMLNTYATNKRRVQKQGRRGEYQLLFCPALMWLFSGSLLCSLSVGWPLESPPLNLQLLLSFFVPSIGTDFSPDRLHKFGWKFLSEFHMLSRENKACSSALDLGFFIFFLKKSVVEVPPIIWMDVKDSMTSLHQKQTELCAEQWALWSSQLIPSLLLESSSQPDLMMWVGGCLCCFQELKRIDFWAHKRIFRLSHFNHLV